MTESELDPRKKSRVRKGRIISCILRVLMGLGILAVIVWLVVGAVAADRLTVPKRVFTENLTPATYDMAYEDITFESRDGRTPLVGWYIPSTTNERVIIFVHGRNASRTAAYGASPADDGRPPEPGKLLELTAAMNKAGYSIFLFDLRGHGQSGEGRFSFGVYERQDVLASVDWLKGKGYQPGKIGMMGLSLGAASSVGATVAEPAVGALVIDSCFAELNPIVEAQWANESGLPYIFLYSTRLMVRLLYGWDMSKVSPADEISQLAPRPLFIIACQDDDKVPEFHFRKLKDAAPVAQTWLLPHCIHGQTYNANPAEFEKRVISFFDSNLQ